MKGMSANNQTLIKENEGKWYVFWNVQAESWCDEEMKHFNELTLDEARGSYDTRDKALSAALELEEGDATEYGVQFDVLCKDGHSVNIVSPKSD